LQKLKKLGIETVIISTEANPVVSARAHKLKIRCIQDCQDKRAVLEDIAHDQGIGLGEVAFVGNDINDLPCLECVALPIVVQDAHQDVVSTAYYQTKNPGGHGAVREICDLLERFRSGVKSSAVQVHLQSLMKDHENEVYFHGVSSWIKLAAFKASGAADL